MSTRSHPLPASAWLADIVRYLRRGRFWFVACILGLPSTWILAQEFVGLVRPTADIQVSVPVAGVVERVLVRPGQWVREGQPLLELDSRQQSN